MPKTVIPESTGSSLDRAGRPSTSSDPPPSPALPRGKATPLDEVRLLLAEGRCEEALKIARRHEAGGAEMRNAMGVCLLRLGRIDQALTVFRPLAMSGGGFVLHSDSLAKYKINFATTLLLLGQVCGCEGALREVGHEDDPQVRRLRQAIARWKKSLGRWERAQWWFGSPLETPVHLDDPLGEV